MIKTRYIFLICCSFISLSVFSQAHLVAVKQVDWLNFTKKVPFNPVFNAVKLTILHANKYALTTWYDKERKYHSDSTGYLDLQSKASGNENRYRLPAGMAFGLAISLKTQIYDANITGISKSEAISKTIALLTAVAYDHKANKTRSVWGSDWQAAHWAYYSGYAAWLMWDQLTETDQQYVECMMIFEANRLLNTPPLFYKDKDGKSRFPGDSKIEEDAWNAELLYFAAVMMPEHTNSKKWGEQAIVYMIASTALPTDLSNTFILHGHQMEEWLDGYNVEEPGVVVNHDIIHPLYNALSSVINAPIVYGLAGKPTPKAAGNNMDKIYNSLINTRFKSPQYQAPGGTMYIRDSASVYYPQGSDWGTAIYDSFANMDIAAWMYGYDHHQKFNGKYWAAYHVNAVLDQQKRFADGHTYKDAKEDSYFGREAAIATRMASAWMTIWMQYQHPVKFKNDAVSKLPDYKTALKVTN